ncbi:hypothetical protein LUTEI9C_110055 [Luteimonas sp. 9C]|nr:hypothetical protein LUTEI9C_110055 [Luteimonas sp. 9C]
MEAEAASLATRFAMTAVVGRGRGTPKQTAAIAAEHTAHPSGVSNACDTMAPFVARPRD